MLAEHSTPSTGVGDEFATSSPLLLALIAWACASRRGRFIVIGHLVVDSAEAVQAYRIGKTANHGSIGDSRPTALFGYARGHSVVWETECHSTLRLSHNRILTLEPESFASPTHARAIYRLRWILVAALRPLANLASGDRTPLLSSIPLT